MVDSTQLAGIVDAVGSGLAVGSYDVVVVNPDGSVGVLNGAFQVTEDPPPVISAVSPGSSKNSVANLQVLIQGSDFRAGPTVRAERLDPSGVAYDREPADGNLTVMNVTPTEVEISVNTNGMAERSVCVVRVTNTDTTYAEFSPITVTNPAGKFVDFVPGPPLVEARRAPAGASGVPTSTQKFLYVIGGDDGTKAGAKRTIEIAPLDRFGFPIAYGPLASGEPPAFAPGAQRTAAPLSRPSTLAKAARIGDFIYLVGGHDGTAVTGEVLRANVLDPLDVPSIDDLDFNFDRDGPGPEPGVYYYQVTAVLAPSTPYNPGGEPLPSDPQPFYVPDVGELYAQVILSWTAHPDAVAYRIYRSDQPNQAFGQEKLLAEIPATSLRTFTDSGTGTFLDVRPLPVGSLGVWHQPTDGDGDPVALVTARQNHGVAVAPHPTLSNVYFLYAVGGDTGPGAYLDSIEVIRITVGGPRAQSLDAAVAVTETLNGARSELEALVANATNASRITDGKSYLFALSGRAANINDSKAVESYEVLATGELALDVSSSVNVAHMGYAGAVANNSMVMAGAQGGTPSPHARYAGVCGNASCPTEPSTLNNPSWNSLSNVNLPDLYRMGRESFSGYLYLFGGLTTGSVLTNATHYSVLGGTP